MPPTPSATIRPTRHKRPVDPFAAKTRRNDGLSTSARSHRREAAEFNAWRSGNGVHGEKFLRSVEVHEVGGKPIGRAR